MDAISTKDSFRSVEDESLIESSKYYHIFKLRIGNEMKVSKQLRFDYKHMDYLLLNERKVCKIINKYFESNPKHINFKQYINISEIN